jgi:hypothetical protein
MDFRSRASSNFSSNIVSEIESTDFVEALVRLQTEAAGDDLLLDLGRAAEASPDVLRTPGAALGPWPWFQGLLNERVIAAITVMASSQPRM